MDDLTNFMMSNPMLQMRLANMAGEDPTQGIKRAAYAQEQQAYAEEKLRKDKTREALGRGLQGGITPELIADIAQYDPDTAFQLQKIYAEQNATNLKLTVNPVTGEEIWRDGRTGLPVADPRGGADPQLEPMVDFGEAPTQSSPIDIPPPPKGMNPVDAKTWTAEAIKVAMLDKKNQDATRRSLEAGLPESFSGASQILQNLESIRTDPGLESAVGNKILEPDYAFGLEDEPFAGSKSKDFETRLSQIKGEQFLQAYERLKGGGAITGIEGTKGEQAIARMDTAQSEGAFNKALDDFSAIVEKGIKRQLDQAKSLGIDVSGYDVSSLGGKRAKLSGVIQHPQYGNVTEDDISATMKANGLTRQQVLDRLGDN